MSGMLSNNQVVTTLLGTNVTVTINSMGVFIDNAMVTVADIVADNGCACINAVLFRQWIVRCINGIASLDIVVHARVYMYAGMGL